MRDINKQALNKINIVGKLLDKSFTEGTMSNGKKYERANLTVRVTQMVDNREETSEIPVVMFASPYTNGGSPNPAYDNIQHLKSMHSVQDVGEAEADIIVMTSAQLQENNFVSRNSGQLINTWQIRNSFVNVNKKAKDIASFTVDAFIMDMHDEVDSEGDPTGRLIIKGGIVQYAGRLDVLTFIVESPEKVDYVQRSWNINETVKIGGRIRYTSREENKSAATSSWGEELPETTTRTIRELIVTTGNDSAYDEDFSYDPADIKKAFNVRKANIEQLQIDAKKGGSSKPAAPASGVKKYDWE